MQIDITALSEADLFTFSHSAAEGGDDAGRNTWKAALEDASTRRPSLLSSPEAIESFKDWVKDFGAWSEDERNAWTDDECNALFLQWVAGDVRECPAIIDGVTIYEREEADKGGVFQAVWYFDHDSTPDEETGPFESRSDAYQAACDAHYRVNQQPRAESIDEIDWLEYEAQARGGNIPANIYRADDGRIYFSLQH
jgi:hypothetical protein